MKLALYHPWLKAKGGAERLVFEYASRSSHDVEIFTQYHEGSFEDYDVSITTLTDKDVPDGFLRKGIALTKTQLGTDLDLDGFDALLVSEAGLGSLITLRNHDLPTMVYTHTPLRAVHQFYDYYMHQYGPVSRHGFRAAATTYRHLEKRAWRYFDRIAVNSHNTKETLKDAGLVQDRPCRVIYPGIDPAKFDHSGKGDYFLYPGRFKSYKRHELAIEAFEEFADSHDGFELVLAGFPDDEDYLQELKETYGHHAWLQFETDLDDDAFMDLYSEAHTVLFTAKNEDWGIVPLEAMAAGKPVISVDEGGPAESIVNGETGFLVDAEPEAIAAKMRLLVDDEARHTQMVQAAASRSKRYTWTRFGTDLDEEVDLLVQ